MRRDRPLTPGFLPVCSPASMLCAVASACPASSVNRLEMRTQGVLGLHESHGAAGNTKRHQEPADAGFCHSGHPHRGFADVREALKIPLMKKNPTPKKGPSMSKKTKGSGVEAQPPKTTRESLVKPVNVPLTARQEAFVREYLIDLNGTQAAIRAGYSAATARHIASQNLAKLNIQSAIAAAQLARAKRTEITADRVLKEIWSIAIADPRELVQIKVGCCRSCWGEGHKWQRTVAEMSHDSEAFVSKGGSLADFDMKGGTGFDRLKPPHPLCPSCGGDGTSRIVLADTQNLSPVAAALYAGAKTGKYGVEIAMHSKVTALEMVAKHLGLYREDNTQKVDALQSLLMGIAGGNASGFRPVAIDPEHAEPSPSAPDADDDD